jgi:LmbE family N-acetylglucosaminyl deacetylase
MNAARVLVIAAHPDDELLGAGATIKRHADEGALVDVLIACEGVTVRYAKDHEQRVCRQAASASEILGVRHLAFGGLPDQRLDTLPLVEVVSLVERHVQSTRPDLVYTHCGQDVNRDHRVLLEAVQVATRPYAAPFVTEVLMFETPSSTEWGSPVVQHAFVPQVIVDVSSTIEAKVAAFCCYEQEVRPAPHPRSPEALRARAAVWGNGVGVAAAEPFQVLRALR